MKYETPPREPLMLSEWIKQQQDFLERHGDMPVLNKEGNPPRITLKNTEGGSK